MRKLRWSAGALLAAVLLTAGSMWIASEQGGEIVTLTTFDADGSAARA